MGILYLFKEYFRDRQKNLAMFILFSVIFAIVFYLYNLPAEPVGYGVLLCVCFGGLYLVLDLWK